GSTASASFTVTAVDDAPAITPPNRASVFESGLAAATSETASFDPVASYNAFVASLSTNSATGVVSGRLSEVVFTASTGANFGRDDNPAHGFVADKTVTVTDSAGLFALTGLDLGAVKDDTLLLTGFDALGHVVASATVRIDDPVAGGTPDHFDATG